MKKEWILELAERLDAALTRKASVSRTQAQRMIKSGWVKVNGELVTKAGAAVKIGDRLSLKEKEQAIDTVSPIEPIDLKLKILYEDDACFVFSKPADLTVHPGAGTDGSPTLLNGIAYVFQKKKLPFSSQFVLVHRLDKETTGCTLVAKNPDAHRAFQKQFEARTVKKTYLALAAGVPKNSHALIDAPIGRNVSERTKMSVFKTSKTREAKTQYNVMSHSHDASLLACDLLTGRTHQIRVHLSSIGHPILGDDTYHSPASLKLSKVIKGMCLHAWKLSFHSPLDHSPISITSPLPHEFGDALKLFSLKNPS